MPFVDRREEVPEDKSLRVHPQLPAGEQWVRESFLGGPITAYVDEKPYYYCQYCQGWIEGEALEYKSNTLNSRLRPGNQGEEFYCRRCGKEIAFVGRMF